MSGALPKAYLEQKSERTMVIKNTEDHIAEAISMANRSGIKSFLTGAVVLNKRGKVVSHGWSHYSVLTFAQYRSIHAELHAILRAPLRQELEGGSIAVATIRRKSGNIGLGKPCVICQSLLLESGLYYAHFTVEGDKWDTIEIPSLTVQVSAS